MTLLPPKAAGLFGVVFLIRSAIQWCRKTGGKTETFACGRLAMANRAAPKKSCAKFIITRLLTLTEWARTRVTRPGRESSLRPGSATRRLRFASSSLAPSFHQGRLAIKKAREEAEGVGGKIKLQQANPGDIVGALRRREMREFLRGMNPKDRNSYISKNRENMDPDMALAIVEMPVEFSGVLESE